MPSSAPVCPVPTEQQPLNEYQQLTESWFYRWATLGWWAYLQPIVVLWSLSWIVSGPVAATSFPPAKQPAQFLMFGSAGAVVLPILALLQLYLGWVYVRDRLAQPVVPYEESGWYDGQIWTKPAEVLQRDRLIVTYQIQSRLNRLKWTFGAIVFLLIAGAMIWQLL